VLRHLKVHSVQRDILWSGVGAQYAVMRNLKFMSWPPHFTEQRLIGFKSGPVHRCSILYLLLLRYILSIAGLILVLTRREGARRTDEQDWMLTGGSEMLHMMEHQLCHRPDDSSYITT